MFDWFKQIYAWLKASFAFVLKYFRFITGAGLITVIWNFFVNKQNEFQTTLQTMFSKFLSMIPLPEGHDLGQVLGTAGNQLYRWEPIFPVSTVFSIMWFFVTYYAIKLSVIAIIWLFRRILDVIP